jgi:hypothetical protein
MSEAAVGAHDCIDAAVVVQIASGHTTPHPTFLEQFSRDRRNVDETLARIPRQEHGLTVMDVGAQFVDVVRVMTLRDKKILPSVVVIIKESHSPTRVRLGHGADAGRIAHIVESSIVPVAINCVSLARQVGHTEIGPSVVVVVGEVDAHTGEWITSGVYSHPGWNAYFLKRSIWFLVEEKFRGTVIGDKEIDAPIAIVIGDGNALRFRRLV